MSKYFRAKFKKKLENGKLVLSKRVKIIVDSNSVIRNSNNEVVSIDSLSKNDHLNIEVSDTDFSQAINIKILPPRNV